MSTQRDEDLDITAELPQLNPATGHSVLEGTAEFDVGAATATLRVDAGEHWDLMDELISVRDRIASLETSLTDSEARLGKIQVRYDQLQGQHADLLTHSQEVSRDRDRLSEERLMWLTAKQQLQDQLEQQRIETSSAAQALREALERQQQKNAELDKELTSQRNSLAAATAAHAEALQTLSLRHDTQVEQGQAITSQLHEVTQQLEEQRTSAAALARSLAQELVERDTLQATLANRVQRVATLERQLADTTQQLQEAQAREAALSQRLAQQAQQIESKDQLLIELRQSLASAELRIEQLLAQLELENTHWRTAEQDKERLRQLADNERESFERTRHELIERQAEIGALKDKLQRAGVDHETLTQQLAERHSLLQQREVLINSKDAEISAARDAQSAQIQREALLNESLSGLREEQRQLQQALQAQTELQAATAKALDGQRIQGEQLNTELATQRQKLEQLQRLLEQRDKFVIEQAQELEELRLNSDELLEQLKHREQTVNVQGERITELSANAQHLQEELVHKAAMLSQAQQDLAARHVEQGANARQIDALQQELRQHVEAMNAVRRDIHQVAMQTRPRETETLVRTLSRVDADGVVHLLNKASMTIGRGRDADICIKSDSISRQHACLRMSRDAVIIEDMGSTNGCYVNGRRIKRQLLKDGDKIEIGDIPMKFSARPTGG